MGGIASPYPLNNPILGKMLQERAAAQQQPQAPVPGPSSTPDAMNVAPALRVEHDIAGMSQPPAPPPASDQPQARALASPSMVPQTPLAKVQPTPKSPGEIGSEGEVGRLSAPPPADKSLTHTKANTGAAGWEQIHNPFLRTLAGIGNAVGSGLFPNIAAAIPGTSSRHQLLLHNAEGSLKNQAAERESQDTGNYKAAEGSHLNAETDIGIPAQAEHDLASAENLRHPKADKQGGTVHQDAEGNYWVIHGDGSATQVAPQGSPLKGKTNEPSGGTVHMDDQGNMWVVKGDGSAVPVMPKTPPAATAPTSPANGTPPSTETPNAAPAQDDGSAPPVAPPPLTAPPKQLKGKPPAATSEETTDIKNYNQAKKEGYKGSFEKWQTDEANRHRPVTNINTGGLQSQQQRAVLQVSGQFDNEPIVRNYNVVKEGVEFAKKLGTSGTGTSADDQGLLYAFAKVMDPGSVVREGEYNTVQKYSQSWADTFGFKANRIFSNSPFLTDEARRNMKQTMISKADAARKNYDNVYNEYGRRIETLAGVKNGKQYLTNYGQAFDAPSPTGGSTGGFKAGDTQVKDGVTYVRDDKGVWHSK